MPHESSPMFVPTLLRSLVLAMKVNSFKLCIERISRPHVGSTRYSFMILFHSFSYLVFN